MAKRFQNKSWKIKENFFFEVFKLDSMVSRYYFWKLWHSGDKVLPSSYTVKPNITQAVMSSCVFFRDVLPCHNFQEFVLMTGFPQHIVCPLSPKWLLFWTSVHLRLQFLIMWFRGGGYCLKTTHPIPLLPWHIYTQASHFEMYYRPLVSQNFF